MTAKPASASLDLEMSTFRNRAAWLTEPKARPLKVDEAPVPTPQSDEVVIKVRAVALNPADPAIQALGILIKPENYPYLLGLDVAGVVTAVGPENTRFKEGDRVTAAAMAFTKLDMKYGGFQEYMVGVEPFIAKIPDHVSFNEGCVLPLGLCTAAYSLFMKHCLALDFPKIGTKPNEKGKILLVWGGSSSVGACAIQAAKSAGYAVAATASAKNFGLLEEMGVDYMFDYAGSDAVEAIISGLKDKGELAGIFCAIIAADTIISCTDIAKRLKGRKHVGTVIPPGMPFPEGVSEGVELSISASIEMDTEVAKGIWVDWLADALADGSMKCRPNPEVIGKGLEKLQDAVDVLAEGVSAMKIVVELSKLAFQICYSCTV
ncbi:chaperonin 10-like protein [Xylariales sp. AK1849]|nr:chaperonin 10-like protein [Xylariales sp. AK1849]